MRLRNIERYNMSTEKASNFREALSPKTDLYPTLQHKCQEAFLFESLLAGIVVKKVEFFEIDLSIFCREKINLDPDLDPQII